MFTRQMFVEAVRKEGKIISHLHTKLTPEMLDFRPTPAQRSTRELLEYIPCCAHLIVKCVADGGFAAYKDGAAAIKSAVALDFNAALNHEIEKLVSWVEALPESELNREVKTPPGDTLKLGQAIVSLSLNFLVAYKMQLFLYIKACGRADIGTANCWAGRDATPKK